MKILAVQNRMGIGDTVIFLPFIKALNEKFNSPISLLVKESSKADQFLYQTSYIDEIITLERDRKNNNRHSGFLGTWNLVKDLKKYKFEKIFIFNSSVRFNLIAKLSQIPEIYQYPLLKKYKQHIIDTPKKFLKNKLNIEISGDPEIQISNESINSSFKKYNINKNEINILLGIGGSGPTKRIPAKKFIELINLCIKNYDCKFFLATGNKTEEVEILREILDKHKDKCIPLNEMSISEILPIIKNCDLSVCNDSSFSHLSAGLGKSTIVLMADTPLLYGSYSSKMHPIIPDGIDEVSHGTNGKELINPNKIFEKLTKILS